MSATSTLLLFEQDKLVGFTNDEPWAREWSATPQRAVQVVQRLDRPARRKNATPAAELPVVPKFTRQNALVIHFDGGCRPTNPGKRYGSFRVEHMKRAVFQNERIEFGEGTNNEAEFLALLAGLDWALTWLAQWSGRPAKCWQVRMVTDSQIVCGRVNGTYTANKTEPQQRMAALTAQVHERLAKFGKHEIEWRGRQHNMALFGH